MLSLMLVASAFSLQAEAKGKPRAAKSGDGCESLLTVDPPYIIKEDFVEIRDYAKKNKMIINVMAPNPASLPYSLRKGYLAKPSELIKCKSLKQGKYAGLVQCPPETREALAKLGYTVLGPEHEYLVQRDGQYFYSDYDLLGVYNPTTGQPAYSEEFQAEINTLLGRVLVRHGPLDDYVNRAAIEVKFPVLWFLPSGEVVEVTSKPQLREMYARYNLPCPW
ncbi:MAG: hypothetical protein KF799_12500 [Bdellovibrionales bacterium]|nr:hypothetical protein [Bdellovibrionales bacterium]